MSGEPEKVALVRAFYESGFDPDRLDEFLHPDCVYHGPDGDVEGIEALRAAARELHRAFPDLRLAVEGVRVDGPEIEVQWTLRGTHEGPLQGFGPTGRSVEMSGRHVEVVRGGRIVERFAAGESESLARALAAAGEDDDFDDGEAR